MGITLLSIAIASIAGWLGGKLETWWGFPVGGISSMAVFGLLYFAFDRVLWRLPPIRKILLVPDLNGRWIVEGRTTIKKGEPVDWRWNGVMTISQSWSSISVTQRTSHSPSHSTAASLYREPGRGYRLIYHYDNNPLPDQQELSRHCGLCNLLFTEDARSAEGQYFTDRDRLTVGTMQLTKEGVTG